MSHSTASRRAEKTFSKRASKTPLHQRRHHPYGEQRRAVLLRTPAELEVGVEHSGRLQGEALRPSRRAKPSSPWIHAGVIPRHRNSLCGHSSSTACRAPATNTSVDACAAILGVRFLAHARSHCADSLTVSRHGAVSPLGLVPRRRLARSACCPACGLQPHGNRSTAHSMSWRL